MTIANPHVDTASTHCSATPPSRRIAILGAAVAIATLFDRLVIGFDFRISLWERWGLFCLITVAIGIALFATHARRSPLWWITGAATIACCVWLIIFNHTYDAVYPIGISPNTAYAALTSLLVLPALLMAFLQLSPGLFDVHRPAQLVADWFRGWFISPFSHWDALAVTLKDFLADCEESSTQGQPVRLPRKIGIALLIALPIMALLIPLLMQADEMFSYAVMHIISGIDLNAVLFHAAVIIVPIPLIHSLLVSVNGRSSEPELTKLTQARQRQPFDAMITAMVMGIVLALYAAFCIIQLTFLFAGAGLPAGYSYAGYARQGFFQLLLVAALNFAGSAMVLLFTPRTKAITGMQVGLLTATGVMLVSAATRLALYIDAYGMTWLRWLSLSFITVLALMLLLALARLFNDRIPLTTIAFILLMAWWLMLGYSNPSWVVDQWNTAFAE